MDRTRLVRQGSGWLLALTAALACGCQTVRTPEEKIAKSNLPREFTKVSMPDYVVEPPDLLIVEVLEALPGRPVSGERLVRPDGKISLGFYGEVYVAGLTTDEIKEKIVLHFRKYITDETLGLLETDPETGKPKEVKPKDSNRVFVDVTSYNSKYYYVQGDVAAPGKMPITGNETVLDAINYAGGLLATAAPQNIRLVRPAPPGACCEQVLPGQSAVDRERGRPLHELPTHARRPRRGLSRPDCSRHDLHRPHRRTVPDRVELRPCNTASPREPSSSSVSRCSVRAHPRRRREDPTPSCQSSQVPLEPDLT